MPAVTPMKPGRGTHHERREPIRHEPAKGLGLVLGPKYPERTGVAVKESGATNRADFAVTEKASQRNLAQFVLEDARIVIGSAI